MSVLRPSNVSFKKRLKKVLRKDCKKRLSVKPSAPATQVTS